MDVITVESEAYKDLVSKIGAIAKFVIDHQDDDTTDPDGTIKYGRKLSYPLFTERKGEVF